jgi:hypothetical protein
MIVVDGKRVKAKNFPRQRLLPIWKRVGRGPFPRVRAFQLKDDDFDDFVRMTKCRSDERREMEEWGRVLSAKGTDACVYNSHDSSGIGYIILVRENPYHDTEKILEHELSHIAKGDL